MKTGLKRTKQFVPQWLRNKFVLTGVLFLLWVLLFDPISLIDLARERQHLRKLEKEQHRLQQNIDHTTRKIKAFADPDSLVKVAREQFYFHGENEEVFILE